MEGLKHKLEQSQLLTEGEVGRLAQTAIEVLLQEPNLLELASPQHIVGDIHGQFYDLLQMMRLTSTPSF